MDLEIIEDSEAADGTIWAYPDFGSNLEMPEDKRAAVQVRLLTGRELQKQKATPLMRQKRQIKDIFAEAERRISKDREKQLREKVVGLRNFFLKSKTERVEIKTIDQLIDVALSKHTRQGAQLMLDMLNAIYDVVVGGSQLSEELESE